VHWDKPSTILPYKVSPWEIELNPSHRFKSLTRFHHGKLNSTLPTGSSPLQGFTMGN
ncbi:hypothetical protein Tco_0387969, partial [Tanacetum coccineum]